MSHRKTLSRLTLASLVAAALAAPAATAMPTDPTGAAQDEFNHPSTTKPDSVAPDRRGEAAAERSSPIVPRQLPGPPTWPTHPQSIDPAPAKVADGDGGGGDDVPVLAIILGGALVVAGGTAATAVTLRHRARVAH